MTDPQLTNVPLVKVSREVFEEAFMSVAIPWVVTTYADFGFQNIVVAITPELSE